MRISSMKIKVTLPILNYEGKPFQKAKLNSVGEAVTDEKGRPEYEPQTLRDIFVNSINSQTPDEQSKPRTLEQSMRIYRLTNRIYTKTNVDLDAKERELIRDRVAAIYSPTPAIVGFVTDALFPEDKPEGDEVVEGVDSEDAQPAVEKASGGE
jgi:hypothetical protein